MTLFFQIVSLQANIRNETFAQKSPRHPEVGKKVALKKNYLFYLIFFIIVSSQANIRNTFLDQKSPQHPELGFLFGLSV